MRPKYSGPLAAEAIAQYHENGYLAVNDVLSQEEIQELRDVTDDFIERSREVSESDSVFDLEPDHSAERPRLRRHRLRQRFRPRSNRPPNRCPPIPPPFPPCRPRGRPI